MTITQPQLVAATVGAALVGLALLFRHERRRRRAARAGAGRPPTIALVNEAQLCEVEGIAVRSEGYIRKDIVWVGREG